MSNPTFERIEADIKANPVVLFMKGTPVFPQCGFSARVVFPIWACPSRA